MYERARRFRGRLAKSYSNALARECSEARQPTNAPCIASYSRLSSGRLRFGGHHADRAQRRSAMVIFSGRAGHGSFAEAGAPYALEIFVRERPSDPKEWPDHEASDARERACQLSLAGRTGRLDCRFALQPTVVPARTVRPVHCLPIRSTSVIQISI